MYFPCAKHEYPIELDGHYHNYRTRNRVLQRELRQGDG
jgi:hypothetical protein